MELINLDRQCFSQPAKDVLADVAHITDSWPECIDAEAVNGSAEGLIVRFDVKLDKPFLQQFPDLSVVSTVTTGLNHIDLEYCREQDITVLSLAGESEFLHSIRASPEHTWGLLLSLIRKIPQAHNTTCDGLWHREAFIGEELHGKRIGIVGFGRMGQIVGRYAHAFGMSISAHDIDPQVFDEYPFEWQTLSELLMTSDVILVAASYSPQSHGLLGPEEFVTIKRGAYLINTARGGLIDEEALLKALETKKLSGVALDVIQDELDPASINQDHPLIRYARTHTNLIITPHIAGYTRESLERTAIFMAQKLRTFLKERETVS